MQLSESQVEVGSSKLDEEEISRERCLPLKIGARSVTQTFQPTITNMMVPAVFFMSTALSLFLAIIGITLSSS